MHADLCYCVRFESCLCLPGTLQWYRDYGPGLWNRLFLTQLKADQRINTKNSSCLFLSFGMCGSSLPETLVFGTRSSHVGFVCVVVGVGMAR